MPCSVKNFLLALLTSLALLSLPYAFAWDSVGHRVSAAIASNYLSDNSKTELAKLGKLLISDALYYQKIKINDVFNSTFLHALQSFIFSSHHDDVNYIQTRIKIHQTSTISTCEYVFPWRDVNNEM